MTEEQLRAKARSGLFTADHSKRGTRFITILDGETRRVTLLEPWEHAVLVLCDGTRTEEEIAELLAEPLGAERIDLRSVRRALKFFEREELIEAAGFRRQPTLSPAGPRTLAEIQIAYREWHRDPERTGQILAGMLPPPISPAPPPVRAGLAPTVALPEDEEDAGPKVGTTLYLAEARSLLEGPAPTGSPSAERGEPSTEIGALNAEMEGEYEDEVSEESADVAELLRAVDDDFERVLGVEGQPLPAPERAGGEARPPEEARERTPPPAKVLIQGTGQLPVPAAMPAPSLPRTARTLEVLSENGRAELTRDGVSAARRPLPALSEAALRPTMVGLPPEDPRLGPVILVPRREDSRPRSPPLGEAPPQVEAVNEDTLRFALEHDSDLRAGAIVEDVSMVEGPTEAAFAAALPRAPSAGVADGSRGARRRKRAARGTPATRGESPAGKERRAKEVFARLQRAGLTARSRSAGSEVKTELGDHPLRRRDDEAAARFEDALLSLSAGDLELALKHFKRLRAKLPASARVEAFIENIEAAIAATEVTLEDGAPPPPRRPSSTGSLLSFEGALEEAVAYGRCPACFSMVARNFKACFACGFALDRR